jgi:hypothetical protein
MLVSPDHRRLLPTAALLGGLLVLGLDDFTRTVLRRELPSGVLTALIGTPIACFLSWKTQGRGWEREYPRLACFSVYGPMSRRVLDSTSAVKLPFISQHTALGSPFHPRFWSTVPIRMPAMQGFRRRDLPDNCFSGLTPEQLSEPPCAQIGISLHRYL